MMNKEPLPGVGEDEIFDLRKTGFYPDHYRNSKDMNIQATIDTCSKILSLFQNELEALLQKWTLSEGVDSLYATQVCNFLGVTYIDAKCFQFMKLKKTPMNADHLKKAFWTVFPEFASVLKITTQNFNIHLLFDFQEGDPKTYLSFQKYLPFFQTYLPLCVPLGYTITIECPYHITIQNLEESGKTIGDLEEYTIEEIQLWERIPE